MFREDYSLEISNEKLIEKITEYLINKDKILSAYIFGSFGTEDFNSQSDIDIAILTNGEISYNDCLRFSSELEDIIGFPVDLNDIKVLPEYIQAQVIMKNKQLFCKNDMAEDRYLNELNHWIKTEYPFWRKLVTAI